ncbi:hypothetical protein SDC9_116870 [bioreactor metagenome]|uniref:Uncharacterized protein n=1 Tax=bioreactor metagenome TaxID=1076179 RepID=A0A645BX90_9ZZZZ
MARAILHIGDLIAVAAAIGTRTQLVQQAAHQVHDLDVRLFVPAADVVGLTELAAFEHAADGAAVVLDVEPIANLHAITIDRQRLARQGVHDHQWDQLFGEMVGAVVVAAVGRQHRHAIGVVPCAHQMVAGRLGGRVRAVRLVVVVFGECWVRCLQSAVDLVGRYVQKAECLLVFRWQRRPVLARRFEQAKGAHHIGLDEILGPVDRTIHMRFGRKIHNRARLMLFEQTLDQCRVSDITLDEMVARIALQGLKVLQIARVGELVNVDHRLVVDGQPVQHEVGANETSATSNKNHGNKSEAEK